MSVALVVHPHFEHTEPRLGDGIDLLETTNTCLYGIFSLLFAGIRTHASMSRLQPVYHYFCPR